MRFNVDNPTFMATGPCKDEKDGMIKVTRFVGGRTVYGNRNRYTYTITSDAGDVIFKQGTMTPTQAAKILFPKRYQTGKVLS